MRNSKFKTTRIVLRSYPAEDEVDEFAGLHGWPRRAEVEARREGGSPYTVSWDLGDESVLDYVEDGMSKNCYLIVHGPTRESVEPVGEMISEELFPWDHTELLWCVDNAPNPIELGLSIIRLALGSPDGFHDETFRRVKSGLTHPDSQVRDMSLWASTYSPWAEYIPLLQNLAAQDPVTEIRERAGLVLEAYRVRGGGDGS
ncbi:hypothetical protein ACIQOW_24305 [Kitasatospora sp. NPDC091335]|uniref:hypothetical protein n=1 Tax=Kitasatospora sp. NPDC091335 TaxID=3364085 RepID=UPI00381E95AA